jgi:hypothetical protein
MPNNKFNDKKLIFVRTRHIYDTQGYCDSLCCIRRGFEYIPCSNDHPSLTKLNVSKKTLSVQGRDRVLTTVESVALDVTSSYTDAAAAFSS